MEDTPVIVSQEVLDAIDQDPQAYLDQVFSRPGPFVLSPLVTRAMDKLDKLNHQRYLSTRERRHALRMSRLTAVAKGFAVCGFAVILVLTVPHIVGYAGHGLGQFGSALNASGNGGNDGGDVSVADAAKPIFGSAMSLLGSLLPLACLVILVSVAVRFALRILRNSTR